ncbi:MAG: hypothetical protein ACI4JF_01075 [Oscillospiraceae bacterium]
MDNEEVVFDQADVEKNKAVGIVMSVFPILFFLPLVSNDMKQSAYLKFRMNQCFILLIADIVINVIGKILSLIPLIGGILTLLLSLFSLVLYIINLVYACQGSGKKLPIIGGIEIFK